MTARLRELAARLRPHAPAVGAGAAALALAVAGFWLGSTGLARARALQAEAARLEATLAGANAWLRSYRPPVAAESTAWALSERRVRELPLAPGARVALAQAVAQRADELGIAEVRVRFEPTDTIAPLAARVVGARSFGQGATALSVELLADYADIVRFVGSLPPQVEVRRLALGGTPGGVRARLLLTTYGVEGGE
jgi:hypothetical protein